MPRRPVSAAGLVFALLVLATVAAFAWSQRLKRDPLLLDHISFSSGGSRFFTPQQNCRFKPERIRFRMTSSDHATVQVIAPGGRLVRTIARDRFMARYNYFTFYWDGRDRAGALAPSGRYKLRVRLLEGERTLVPPGVIRLRRLPLGSPAACRRIAKGAT
jgi:FlgD Ig-like domain